MSNYQQGCRENERLSSQTKLFLYRQGQEQRRSRFRWLLAANTGLCIHRNEFLCIELQLCWCLFGMPAAAALKHFNKSSLLCQSYKAGRKLQVAFFQLLYVLQLCLYGQSLPILKESGPPAVLLTNMAKKSRSTQAVSIFYESSWVLPRGCPCHSHLKQGRQHTLHTSSYKLESVPRRDRLQSPAGDWLTCTWTVLVL